MVSDIRSSSENPDITFVRLSDLIASADNRGDLDEFLRSFRCSKNEDVQKFLHKKAVLLEDSHKSRTYLIVTKSSLQDPDLALDVVGYFTIALKHVELGKKISNAKRKKINGLSTADNVVGYLIGQLAKNDSTMNPVPGSVILDAALHQISRIQMAIGGRFVLVECEHSPKLISFYEKHNFAHLQDDSTDKMAQLFYFL